MKNLFVKKQQVQKSKVPLLVAFASLMVFSGLASAGGATVTALPDALDTVWNNLGAYVGLLLGAAIVLFGMIRGGTGLLKVASRFFGAAGA